MTEKEIQREMLSYYNERAKEHDIVYMGKGPALQQYSDEYARDVARISEMASDFGNGHVIDIACGTGFWAPHYARNCSHVTFVDQSASMLSECRNRVEALGQKSVFHFIRGNFFDVELPAAAYDCALIGFLLSHLVQEQEEALFSKLGEILKPTAQLMVIDSAWSEKREGHRRKAGIEERTLEDGRTFRVYKKYFEHSEIHEMLKEHGFIVKSFYGGDMLLAAIADRVG